MITAAFITTLLIFSAYPDPLQAENGGEAVQLHNPTEAPLSLGGFVLATKTSTYPLPSVTVLPGAGYLIADTGWSGPAGLRDNLSWPDADHEIGMSLANADGLVELRQMQPNGSFTVLDRLVWNSTVGRAREGYAWTHEGEARPFFFNSSMQLVPFTITLEETLAPPTITNITLPDDSPQEGIQLLGYARNLTITATVTGNPTSVIARLANRETELERQGNTSLYRGTLAMPLLASGAYELIVTARGEGGESVETIAVTVLPTATIAIERATLTGTQGAESSGSLTVMNIGNARRTVRIATLPTGVRCEPPSQTLEPGANATFTCTAAPGRAWTEATGYALVETNWNDFT